MSDSNPNDLIQAESLINEGKKEEALEIVRKYQRNAWDDVI